VPALLVRIRSSADLFGIVVLPIGIAERPLSRIRAGEDGDFDTAVIIDPPIPPIATLLAIFENFSWFQI
jgi:hypothetical protein